MTSLTCLFDTVRSFFSRRIHSAAQTAVSPQHRKTTIVTAVLAFSLTIVIGVAAFASPSAADKLKAYVDSHAQKLSVSQRVSDDLALTTGKRDSYTMSPGIKQLEESGTNYDWARLVLIYGGWPQTDDSITVILRWMRQENGTASWWNRNNPLNNGWGSGGGSGTGSYANLDTAAQMVVAMLNGNPGMSNIVTDFKAGAPSAVTEADIWASPWAGGHYGNGANWHYTAVDKVAAPASAW